MIARPIIFSAPMVRALLAGRKTQTRRIVKPQPQGHHWENIAGYKLESILLDCTDGIWARFAHSIPQNASLDWERDAKCPYGRPGDLLWVREAVCTDWSDKPVYKADDPTGRRAREAGFKNEPRYKPSIHMPRWASRLTLQLTDIRVHRLCSMSAIETLREGVSIPAHLPADGADLEWAQREFTKTWEAIHGAGSWGKNPWVWALTFKVIKQNVDDVLKAQVEHAALHDRTRYGGPPCP